MTAETEMKQPLRYASVCDGIGAVHLAWKPLGWECAWTSEIEPFPAAVVEHHHGFINVGDMTKITEDQLHERGPIELLVGGTPCQSFSVAGLRGGLDDARGNLALRFLQLAAVARPRWLLWENVPGVLSSGDGRDFGCILGGLGKLGYGYAFRVLDAQYFGVPQRRRRVFVVGCLGSWQRAAAVLFERHSLSGNPAPSRQPREGIAGGIAPSPGISSEQGGMIPEISPAIKARDCKGPSSDGDGDGAPLIAHALRAEGFDASEDGTGRGTPLTIVPIQEIGKRCGKDRPQNGSGIGEDRDPMFTLQASAQHGVAVCFDSKGTDAQAGEVSPTMRSMNFNGSHANGGGQLAVAYQCHGTSVGPMGTLRAGNGNETGGVPFIVEAQDVHVSMQQVQSEDDGAAGSNQDSEGDGVETPLPELHPVAFQTRIARNGRGQPKEITDALTSCEGGTHADSKPHVAGTFGVRRLMPVECERLQGFPDNFTAIKFKGKPAADGPRYRALGNSMAVPCMAWIGQRIQMVDALPAP
jgi:DNA (cytosine-5)-methyltransferase 1